MLHLLVIALVQIEILRGSIVSGNEVQEEKMVLAFVVNRHGERSPDIDELALSHQQEKIKNLTAAEGLEGLTNTGKRRAFQIGTFIRQRYGSQGYRLLSNSYFPNEIAVRSTDKDRTKMTAQVAMAALYPPEGEEQWNEGLGKLWQPVPYTAMPLSIDYLRYFSNCKRFKDLMGQAKTNATNEEFRQFEDLATLVKKETGKDFGEDLLLFKTLFDLLRSTVSLGLDIPDWAKPLLPKLGEAAKLAYKVYYRSDEMKKIGGGVILNDFIQAATDIASGKPVNKRFRMYSGHDFNIGSLMEVTKVVKDEQSIPEYGSLFGIELYRSETTRKYTVLPIYLPKAGESTAQVLHFSYCESSSHCSLDKFIENTKEFVLTKKEYYRNCSIKTFSF